MQKGDAVCGFYHKNKENGKGVSATMDISLHEDLHKNAVMADIFCLQAGRFQIESFIQADEYGANFSLERIWANDEKEPRLTSMPQLMIDMVTPVKDYEKYDFHVGMNPCQRWGEWREASPNQLLAELREDVAVLMNNILECETLLRNLSKREPYPDFDIEKGLKHIQLF